MKPPEKAGLGPRQTRFATLMAAGHSIRAAAREVKLSERQAHRWLELPHVLAEVARQRDTLLSQAVGLLSAAASKAALTLAKLLDDESPGIRLQAARDVLGLLLRAREVADIAVRVAELEAMASKPHVDLFPTCEADVKARGLDAPATPDEDHLA